MCRLSYRCSLVIISCLCDRAIYSQDEYPDIVENPPNISDLTVIYKAAKNRFDADEAFKTRSRNNVVNLQVHCAILLLQYVYEGGESMGLVLVVT